MLCMLMYRRLFIALIKSDKDYIQSPVLVSFDSNGLVVVLDVVFGSLFLVFFLLGFFLLRSDGFDISGDEEVDHNVPLLVDWVLTSKDEDFSSQQPEHH